VISGFRREVAENCVLLGYYAASSGNSLSTFRDRLKKGQIGSPETSVKNYHYSLRNSPEERSFQDERDPHTPQQLINLLAPEFFLNFSTSCI